MTGTPTTERGVVERLDELIAITRAVSGTADRWLDAVGIAALLGYKRRYVLERLAPRPDFPKPMRVGQPRWLRSEVMAWAEAQRKRTA